MNDGTTVTCDSHGKVRLVRIAAPPDGILSARGTHLLSDALENALNDPDARAVVIAGADRGVFIRHYDLHAIIKAAEALRSGAIEADSFVDADFARLTDRIAAADIPVIAAINGICMGGGFELALACDIRIAQRDVLHIGLPEIRVDILPGGGGTIRLARLIGEGPALDIALRGRTITAERAFQLGIVSDVVDDAIAGALRIAEALALRDPAALQSIKRLVRAAIDLPLAEGLRRERLAFAAQLAASDRAIDSMKCLLAAGTMLEDAPHCDREGATGNARQLSPARVIVPQEVAN